MNVLFVCSRNRLRSPTAEKVFQNWPGLEAASAGLNHDSDTPLTADLVLWADVIFVMEKAHRKRLSSRFAKSLKDKRVVCLDVPDRYDFMDPELVKLLEHRVPKHLRGLGK
jgi:predicted protein tyrosine phosphatase